MFSIGLILLYSNNIVVLHYSRLNYVTYMTSDLQSLDQLTVYLSKGGQSNASDACKSPLSGHNEQEETKDRRYCLIVFNDPEWF